MVCLRHCSNKCWGASIPMVRLENYVVGIYAYTLAQEYFGVRGAMLFASSSLASRAISKPAIFGGRSWFGICEAVELRPMPGSIFKDVCEKKKKKSATGHTQKQLTHVWVRGDMVPPGCSADSLSTSMILVYKNTKGTVYLVQTNKKCPCYTCIL